ncbi:MAG: NUDIX hydrolase [Planctomycetales bacterium]|nr:NUDIX hydrolase [Planctomycetales bacterium]
MARGGLRLPDAVAVVLERGGRYLLIRRAGDPFRGWWSPVTGGVEAGETLVEAAVREAREEVGLRIAPGDEILACPTADGTHLLHFLRARLVSGRVRPSAEEVAEWGWFTLAEARRLEPFFEADRALYERLATSGPGRRAWRRGAARASSPRGPRRRPSRP